MAGTTSKKAVPPEVRRTAESPTAVALTQSTNALNGVARQVYDNSTIGRLKLCGAVMQGLRVDDTGRIAVLYLDQQMAGAAGATYDDTEGVINQPLTVKEVQAVVFFKQTQGNHYRISLRSKGDADIGAVAKEFGGGGHKNAAGCSADGPIDELRNIFVDKVRRAIG